VFKKAKISKSGFINAKLATLILATRKLGHTADFASKITQYH